MPSKAAACLVACLLLIPVPAAGRVYREDSQTGWWWYEDPLKPERKEEGVSSRVPFLTMAQMTEMETDRLREYAEQVLKEAVRDPSEANVRQYYLVQDAIRRKALAFTNASEMVWQKYPELSIAKDDPLAAPGRQAMTRRRLAEQERALAGAKDDFALLYFHSEGCPFCREQEVILHHFIKRYGWQVKAIDVDHQPHLASRFGIASTPALALIHRNSPDYFPVTAGIASVSEVAAKIFRGLRLLRGETTPDTFHLYDFQRGGGFDVGAGR